MNQRIQELLNKTISDVDYIRDDDFTNEELSKMCIPDCAAEKFAQLIIDNAAECVRDVLRDENSELTYVPGDQQQQRIRQYFRVDK